MDQWIEEGNGWTTVPLIDIPFTRDEWEEILHCVRDRWITYGGVERLNLIDRIEKRLGIE